MIIIPSQPNFQLGDTTKFEGKTYKADKLFTQGRDAQGSDVIMITERGAYNMMEVE